VTNTPIWLPAVRPRLKNANNLLLTFCNLARP
jgi:hypothetical protein